MSLSTDATAPLRLVLIGGGPRGVMVLERLLAQLESRDPSAPHRPLELHVVDPYPVGPGRVWRTDQSELYLMNTPSFFPTAAAADNPGLRPSTAAQSFDQWRRVNPEASLGVERNQYPARVVYGRYLTELWSLVSAGLRGRPEVRSLTEHRAEATSLRHRPEGGVVVTLDPIDGSGEQSLTADAAVLPASAPTVSSMRAEISSARPYLTTAFISPRSMP